MNRFWSRHLLVLITTSWSYQASGQNQPLLLPEGFLFPRVAKGRHRQAADKSCSDVRVLDGTDRKISLNIDATGQYERPSSSNEGAKGRPIYTRNDLSMYYVGENHVGWAIGTEKLREMRLGFYHGTADAAEPFHSCWLAVYGGDGVCVRCKDFEGGALPTKPSEAKCQELNLYSKEATETPRHELLAVLKLQIDENGNPSYVGKNKSSGAESAGQKVTLEWTGSSWDLAGLPLQPMEVATTTTATTTATTTTTSTTTETLEAPATPSTPPASPTAQRAQLIRNVRADRVEEKPAVLQPMELEPLTAAETTTQLVKAVADDGMEERVARAQGPTDVSEPWMGCWKEYCVECADFITPWPQSGGSSTEVDSVLATGAATSAMILMKYLAD